jgi:acyl carrier protein
LPIPRIANITLVSTAAVHRADVVENATNPSDTVVLRRQLPLLGACVSPRTPTEQKLVEIWRKALCMDLVGITDNYEELGGDSLLAAIIFAEIEQTFKIEIPMATLVDAPTIEQLADRVDELVSRRTK